MHARWPLATLALLFAVRCSPFSSDDGTAAPEDAGVPADAAPGVPDPEDDPLAVTDDAGALPDAGCGPDASIDEPFTAADLTASGYAVVSGGDGTLGKDPARGTPAPSLHVTVGSADGAKAYLRRALCGATAPIVCELSIKTDAVLDGQAAFFELRGRSGGTATIVRLKTNEIQRSGLPDAGVVRVPLAIGLSSAKAFATVRLTVSPTVSTAVVDGTTAEIAAGLDTIDELRAGILYLNRAPNGMTTARADLLLDEIHCGAPPTK